MWIITLHYNSSITGHLGYQKTQELIECQYYWPRLSSSLHNYGTCCDQCACFKGSNMKPARSAILLEPSMMPWVDVSVDFITNLPLSARYDSILTVVDHFSKEMVFILCWKMATALDTAKLYVFHAWKDHGLSWLIVSDWGPQFASQVMKDLCGQLGITPKMSTAHHPQTNRQIEVANREVQQYLCLFYAVLHLAQVEMSIDLEIS